jgi:isopenicillin N synthase-like dioxygenase
VTLLSTLGYPGL